MFLKLSSIKWHIYRLEILNLCHNSAEGAFTFVEKNVMSKKNKAIKRNEKLQLKTVNDSFKWQIKFNKARLLQGIPTEELEAEIESVCKNGLAYSILTLSRIINGIKADLGIVLEPGKGTLAGSPSAYLLGISDVNPYETREFNTTLLSPEKLPLQIEIFYDNEIRNQVVEWVKERYDSAVTTRLGQPILKLNNMVVAFRRVVKEEDNSIIIANRKLLRSDQGCNF